MSAIAGISFLFVFVTVSWRFYLSAARSNPRKVAIAEDEVYEVVVRHMPAEGAKLLAFDPEALTDFWNGATTEICRERVRNAVWLHVPAPPFYDSLADKLYRAMKPISGNDSMTNDSVTSDAIDDYAKKSCTPSDISTTFHTDLPRIFLPAIPTKVPAEAMVVISLSRVGFDRTLREAIVSTSLNCGVLCGEGWIYVLKKRNGAWKIVDARMQWVS